jgi:hypothetical protein
LSAIFANFLRKNLAFFLKNQSYDQLFSKFSFVLSQKGGFFANFFCENIFKNHNIGPRQQGFKNCCATSGPISLAQEQRFYLASFHTNNWVYFGRPWNGKSWNIYFMPI